MAVYLKLHLNLLFKNNAIFLSGNYFVLENTCEFWWLKCILEFLLKWYKENIQGDKFVHLLSLFEKKNQLLKNKKYLKYEISNIKKYLLTIAPLKNEFEFESNLKFQNLKNLNLRQNIIYTKIITFNGCS